MSLDQYMKNIRKQHNLSKREFAKQLGISAATIVRIENGITVSPSKNLISLIIFKKVKLKSYKISKVNLSLKIRLLFFMEIIYIYRDGLSKIYIVT